MIGKTLAHYLIVEKIGAGGMGEVYQARDTKLDRDVALKVLRQGAARDTTRRRARFEREAKAIAALTHPNIVTVYSVEEDEDIHFITMELVAGNTLAEAIPEDGLPLDKFFELAIPILDAITAAHEAGIAHRDLKPDNIMITGAESVKILDFGLAKLVGDTERDATATLSLQGSGTEEGRIVGTVAYMSPEQATGKVVDNRSDIFSLGIVLYEMITGRRPFEGDSGLSTLSSILRDDPPSVMERRPTVPNHLGRIVSRCLAKNVRERYQTVLDVKNELVNLRTEGGHQVEGQQASAPSGSGPLSTLVTETEGVRKLAVLPLRDLSAEGDQDWFAAGVHEALLSALQQIEGLRVTSRTSSMRYRDADKLAREVARELGVDWLVEGSVVRVGDRIRVSAQLIDGEADQQTWSGQYDRDVRDLLTLQTEIARTISREVHVALTPEEEARLDESPRIDPETYRHYILGVQHHDRVTPADFRKSVSHLEQAIESDPGFAPAHAALAVAYGISAEYGWAPRTEVRPLADRAAREALRLAPHLGDAHHAVASVRFHMHRDFLAAERSYRRALDLSSNAQILRGFGWLLSQTGRHDEAIQALEQAVELDPRSAMMHGDLGWWLYGARRYEQAIAQAEFAIELDRKQAEPHWLLAACSSQQGEFERALGEFARYEEMYGDSVPWFRGYLQALAGRREDAKRALDELRGRIERAESQRIDLAQIYLGLSDDERTIEVLEQSTEAGVSFQPHLWPEYERLHADPRFRRALRRLGYSEPDSTTMASRQ